MKTTRLHVKKEYGDYTTVQRDFLCKCGHESWSIHSFPFNPSNRFSKSSFKEEEFQL